MAFPTNPNRKRLARFLKGKSELDASDVTIALAAGANNVMGITITVVDENGIPVAGIRNLQVWASESATGSGLTADAYSGDLVATAGVVLNSPVAKKMWNVLTNASGVFSGNLTDTAEPQDQYIAVRKPFGGGIKVSAISAGKFG